MEREKRREEVLFHLREEKEIQKGVYKKLIVAIPEIGLVGLLTGRKLIEDLKLKRLGYVYSDVISVIIRYENGKPEPMIRIFGNEDFLVFLYEAPLDMPLVLPFAKFLDNFMEEKDIELPIMLASAPSMARIQKADEEIEVIGAAVGDKAAKILKDIGIKSLRNGTLGGPFAYILNKRFERRKDGIVLLAETFHMPLIDPASAAKLLKVVSRILGVEDRVNIGDLIEKAEELKMKMRKLQEATQTNLPKELGMLYT